MNTGQGLDFVLVNGPESLLLPVLCTSREATKFPQGGIFFYYSNIIV